MYARIAANVFKRKGEFQMIKSIDLKPFTKTNPLPTYARWQGLDVYTLKATVKNGYEITLANLTIGKSMSAQNPLSHVLFESYSDHGKKMSEVRKRAGGYEREFMAIASAMTEAGIEFDTLKPSCPVEDLINEIGSWYKASNHDIQEIEITLQKQK